MTDYHQSYASSSLKSNGPSLSLLDSTKKQNVGVGNYKGVMLCNRPFGASVAGPQAQNSTSEKSFACGVVSEAIGMNVSIANKEKKIVQRQKKETALTKHRKWLIELQKTKDQLEQNYKEETKRKEGAQQRFQEKESQMRQLAKKTISIDDSKAEAKDDPIIHAENKGEFKVEKRIKIPKPAWAMTEDIAKEVEVEKEDEEVDDLIEFAKGLDFDKYIDDMEIHTMMERVKRRIQDLEREADQESKLLDDLEQRKAINQSDDKETKRILDNKGTEIDTKADVYQAAKALLAEDELKNVHSTKSVASLVLKSKEIANEPLIVKHEEADGVRLELKNNPSNLPYLHRNPAV